MPILIKNYTWTQSLSKIYIEIPVKKSWAHPDLVLTEEYLKINSSPYFLEIFLSDKIDVEKSLIQKGDNVLKFELCKQTRQDWPNLSICHDNKTAKAKRDAAEIWRQNDAKTKANQKIVQERTRERQSIEASLEAYDANRRTLENQKKQTQIDFFRDEKLEEIKFKPVPFNTELAAKVAQEKDRLTHHLPQPRNTGVIEFTQNVRHIPAPKRESNLKLEKEWEQKQKEALSKFKLDANLTPEELMRKAETFVQLEDFESAIEAYNYGIAELCPNYAPIWNNRAAVYLQLGKFHHVIKDASKALELMEPPVEANALMRAKALARRGASFCVTKFI